MRGVRHPLLLLAGGVAACVALGLGAYLAASQLSGRILARGMDDLEWLQREFDIPETEMAGIRDLHEAYTTECSRLCLQIAQRKRELDEELGALEPDHAAVEAKLVEIGVLRARCQANMLRHFRTVSEAMPAEQGKRYLEKMRRLTLGSHESIERSMSHPPADAHGHH